MRIATLSCILLLALDAGAAQAAAVDRYPQTDTKEQTVPAPSFSRDELREAAPLAAAGVSFIEAGDGVALAYRAYIPAAPRAVLLFYHGGGAHSGAGYQHIGHGLQLRFRIAVYTPDIRGHGASGGPRGDAPTPRRVWDDIGVLIRHVRAAHPGLPLILGGHSSGAGLVLNYAGQPGHEPVDGYVFVSPQLGPHGHADRPGIAAPFATVDVQPFIANAMSGGRLQGHTPAVRFNYSPEVLAADAGMVASYTVNMSNAVTPAKPREQFENLDRPYGLWIGAEDELFLPEKVLAVGAPSPALRAACELVIVAGAKHLSILLSAHESIGPWIERRAGTGG